MPEKLPSEKDSKEYFKRTIRGTSKGLLQDLHNEVASSKTAEYDNPEIVGALKKLDLQASMDQDAENPSIVIGTPPIRLFPYKKLVANGADISPEDYFEYICSHVANPDDIGRLTNGMKANPNRIFEYRASDRTVINPTDLVRLGEGDCDDFAEFARVCLLRLGQKIGHNFEPRIIVQKKGDSGSHGVCIFSGTDGRKYAIDQNPPKLYVKIEDASRSFTAGDENHPFFEESMIGEMSLRWTLTPDLEKDYKSLDVVVPKRDFDSIIKSPNEYLPSDWKKYATIRITHKENEVEHAAYYKNGELRQLYHAKGDLVVESYKNGELVEREFRSGKYKYIHYKKGKVDFKIDFSLKCYDDQNQIQMGCIPSGSL